MSEQPVTVIGLGLTGSALARMCLAHGHPTTVWNRSPARADDLVARGAVRAPRISRAVAASPLVVVCVADHGAVREVLGEASDALSGHMLVDLTSGTPQDARDTAASVTRLGADHVDGAVLAVPPAIGGPDAMLLYSGSRRAFEAHQPTLSRLGTYLGSDAGLAALYDLALLLAFHGSTIRFYDPSIDAWCSTWIEPVNGRVRRFVGPPAGGDIVLISDEDDPQLRWRFTDIEANSFRWRAESSRDAGATWEPDEEMVATRSSRARQPAG